MRPRDDIADQATRSPAVTLGEAMILDVLLDIRDQLENNQSMWEKLFRCSPRDPPEILNLLTRIETKVDQLLAAQAVTQQKEVQIMATQQDLLDKITSMGTVQEGMEVHLDELIAQDTQLANDLRAAIAANDPTKLQAVADALDARSAAMSADTDKIIKAVTDNTVAAQ